ncbi:MAG TPA: alpha-amylase family protein [Mycobacteriales bacterium]|nr:alpha-amylase family protein [Mycobacteriales bacterium]
MIPWYQRTLRWGQTNLTEIDPSRYDTAWWASYWRRTRVQGVIVNAGGIVAYYPSRYGLHHRARYLGDRDFYGDIVRAARSEGLVVVARMDSNRADEPFYVEHPDWFAVDREGRPYRTGGQYVACVNSPYYSEFLPGVLTEIIERTHPDGFADNSWSGLGRDSICYCGYCRRGFREATGRDLPATVDWDDADYREWITWSYARRVANWDLNNEVTRWAGGEDCLWIGMNGGQVTEQARRLRDHKALCERAPIIFLDSQWRHRELGFQSNADSGMLIHGLAGWDTLIPESMAMYNAGDPTFRLGSKPAAEARMWMYSGFAGGIQPWWHHISAYHEDRRQYRTAEPVMKWHEQNESALIGRRPLATVGVVWSQQNADFYGRDDADQLTAAPYRGIIHALIRARIPYVPVHADHIERDGPHLTALVLPNVGALSDAQCEQIRAFVAGGGGLLATGESSRYDETGSPREDFALADVLGVHATGAHHGSAEPGSADWASWARHSYLRIIPELRAGVDGPMTGAEPPVDGARHPVLAGFEETDVLPFGGRIDAVTVAAGGTVPLTLVPPFPIYPPEKSWMEHPRSDLPALVLREAAGRVAYLAADLDRCFDRDRQPDHAQLLGRLVRWVAADGVPLAVEGPGTLDCRLYTAGDRVVLHLVNLTGTVSHTGPVDEVIPVGPHRLWIRRPAGSTVSRARLAVRGEDVEPEVDGDWLSVPVPSIEGHEVVILS